MSECGNRNAVKGAHSMADCSDCLVETRRVRREKLAKAERWTGTLRRAGLKREESCMYPGSESRTQYLGYHEWGDRAT